MADSSVAASGGAGPAIDTETVTTGAGSVNRQVVALGDPATAGNRATIDNGNLHTEVDRLNGTVVDTNSGVKSAGTQRIVIATDQPALTNAQPSNLTQVVGTALDVNSGNKSAGTPRVVLATDQPALTNPLKVAGSSGNAFLVNPGDAQAGTDTQGTIPMLWNGTNYDRSYGVQTFPVIASAARTTTVPIQSGTFLFPGGDIKGLVLNLYVTAKSGTTTTTMILTITDATGVVQEYVIAAVINVPAGTVQTAICYPANLTGPANALATQTTYNAMPIGRSWSVLVDAGDTTSITYQVSGTYVN